MTDRSKDGTLLAAADDFGKVKLFKFPCPVPSSGFGKYTGHSSYVCSVRFTFDSQYIISVGGDELSIFQWRLDSSPTKLNVDHSKDPPPEEEQQG
jgi:microtubule-associated protein-like 6